MSTSYLSGLYWPPIPILTVRIKQLGKPDATDFYSAILDTGADMSIAPNHLLIDVQAQAVQDSQFVTQWGDVHPVTLYLVDLEVDGQLFPGVMIAGDDSSEEIVLGRNVLNLLALFLDGPRQQTHLPSDATVRRLRIRK